MNPKRIGIVGHSFAGLTPPIAAVRSNDVAFVIALAGLFTDAPSTSSGCLQDFAR